MAIGPQERDALRKRVGEQYKQKDIPVLILSALQMDKDIQKGKELGASDYLPKTNVTMEQVIAKIVQLTASPASPVE